MVSVAQLVEPRIVIPVVVGSSPIAHPIHNGAESVSIAPAIPMWFTTKIVVAPRRASSLYLFGPLAQLVEQLSLNQ